MRREIPTLTFADAVKAARKAFDEKRLGAQNGHIECMYDYGDGTVCAIGASFVPHDPLLNNAGIHVIVLADELAVPDSDLRLLDVLQRLHDDWLEGRCWTSANVTGADAPWIIDLARTRDGQVADAALFESFLDNAERELGLA